MRSSIVRLMSVFIATMLSTAHFAQEVVAQDPPAVPPMNAPTTVPMTVPSAPMEDPASPEGVLRNFLLAVIDADLEAVKANSLPNKGIDAMVNSPERPPAEALEPIRLAITQLPIRRMEIGEEMPLPSGKKIKISKGMVTEDRLQLTMPQMPIPFDVRRVEGAWKVDPQMMIDSHKAAAKAKTAKQNKY